MSSIATAAMLSVLAASLTFIGTQINEAIRRRHEAARAVRERDEEKRLRREALLIAFYGEVSTLENFLWMEAQRGLACVTRELPIEIRTFRIPRDIFDANTGSLGELGDSHLVAGLVTLYAIAEHVVATARELAAPAAPINVKTLRYLQDLASCLGSAVNIHAWLREQTRTLREVPSRVTPETFRKEHGDHIDTADQLLSAVSRRLVVREDI